LHFLLDAAVLWQDVVVILQRQMKNDKILNVNYKKTSP